MRRGIGAPRRGVEGLEGVTAFLEKRKTKGITQ
jgi:hypothetical protein